MVGAPINRLPTEPTKKYVLEKAASVATELHQKHGVFVGNQDLGTDLVMVHGCQEYAPLLSLCEEKLQEGLKMKDLYQVMHNLGPYRLGSMSCHHAALKVYNHCCAWAEDQVQNPPNQWLEPLAGFASRVGTGFYSESDAPSGVPVNSQSAQSASDVHDGVFASFPAGFTEAFDIHSKDFKAFVLLAAALSSAVYEEDVASALVPQEAASGVLLHNKLSRRVVLYDHGSRTRHAIEAGQKCSLALEKDRALVDVNPSYAGGWISGRALGQCLARKQSIWKGHVYELNTDFRQEVVLHEVAQVHADVLHSTQKALTPSPVQWLLARSGSAMYVCFRGTSDIQDAAVDLSAVPDYQRFKEHGIGVHSGIANTLEQQGDVANVVKEVGEAVQQHRKAGEKLVLCGHSLGGGYAQIMAIHLLSKKVEISSVLTFGTPHVLVPPKGSPQLWQRLQAITQHFVFCWDPVPRLPLCTDWLVQVLPALKEDCCGLRVGIPNSYVQALEKYCKENKAPMLGKYDVVGQLVNLTGNTGYTAAKGAKTVKELLNQKPPESVMTASKLFAYHSMSYYLEIVQKLMES